MTNNFDYVICSKYILHKCRIRITNRENKRRIKYENFKP